MLARPVLETDFNEIRQWCFKWDHPMPDRSLFPKMGFIIDGIAVGFLYLTDSKLGIIDCYISNPDTDSETRSSALDAITIALIDYARSHKCKIVKCDTKLEAVKQRALKHRFRTLGTYESFSMEL